MPKCFARVVHVVVVTTYLLKPPDQLFYWFTIERRIEKRTEDGTHLLHKVCALQLSEEMLLYFET